MGPLLVGSNGRAAHRRCDYVPAHACNLVKAHGYDGMPHLEEEVDKVNGEELSKQMRKKDKAREGRNRKKILGKAKRKKRNCA